MRINLIRLISVFIIIISLYGCELCEPVNDVSCPLPDYYHDILLPTPPEPHMEQRLSPNGDKLAFLLGFNPSILEILDLKTDLKYAIDIKNKLPTNIKYVGIGQAVWCPYNNNRLLIDITSLTDTVGDGKNYVYGQNLYVISLDGSEFQRITPKIYPSYGSSRGINDIEWLIESKPDRDLISGFFGPSSPNIFDKNSIKGIYIPQTDEFITPNPYKALLRQARNGNYLSDDRYDVATAFPSNIYLNGFEIHFYKNPSKIIYVSWSKDSKKLALSITPGDSIIDENSRLHEIWFIDVGKFMEEKPDTVPVQIINIRKQFCMYGGIWAEFLTDTTLAVSMCGPKDNFSYLWEITTDGRIVRQLTFEP